MVLTAPLIEPSCAAAQVEWCEQDGGQESAEAEKIKFESKEDNWFAEIELPAYKERSVQLIHFLNNRLLENSLKLFCPPPNFS